jgi:hypothetical protein
MGNLVWCSKHVGSYRSRIVADGGDGGGTGGDTAGENIAPHPPLSDGTVPNLPSTNREVEGQKPKSIFEYTTYILTKIITVTMIVFLIGQWFFGYYGSPYDALIALLDWLSRAFG